MDSAKKYPKKLNSTPLISAITEIIFKNSKPLDIVFSSFYNKLKDDYSNVIRLPELQIPPHIRENDPALKYIPCYALNNNEDIFKIFIGQHMISVTFNENKNKYPKME